MRTRPSNVGRCLKTTADQADILSDAVESGDPRYVAYVLGTIARAGGGIGNLARAAGMSRQALHKALSEEGNPTLETVLKVLKPLGFRMRIEPVAVEASMRRQCPKPQEKAVPRQSTVVSIFLASPSDVAPEREIIVRTITQWNAIRGKERNLVFEIIRWETNTSSGIGADAQDVINTQISDDYDVMIAVFWTRLGTETARASSGTVEEYERVLDRYRAGEPIQVGVYFKMLAPSLDGFKPQQYQGVLDLKDRLKSDGVYFKEFTDHPALDFEINILLDRLARNFGGSLVPDLEPGDEERGGEITPVSTDEGEEAEDVGFLDIVESMEQHTEPAVNFLNGSTEWLERIGTITEASTARINELKALGPVQPSDMRPLISELTDAFDQYSDYLENGLDQYALHNNGFAEDTRKLIDVSSDFENSPEQVNEARGNFQQFIDSMSEAIEGMKGFAESVSSLQRMTVKFNHSRKRLVANIEKLIGLISYSRTVVTEAMDTLPTA